MEDNLLYSEFTDLNVIHIKKKKKHQKNHNTVIVLSRLEFDQEIGNRNLGKLTHEISHHR